MFTVLNGQHDMRELMLCIVYELAERPAFWDFENVGDDKCRHLIIVARHGERLRNPFVTIQTQRGISSSEIDG